MKNILAIDDDKDITLLLEKYFTAAGHRIVVTNNPGDGLNKLDNGNSFDVVITDIGMPGLDGNEVARQIRNKYRKDIPIIAITGSLEEEVQNNLFNNILYKPVKLNKLNEIINSYSSL